MNLWGLGVGVPETSRVFSSFDSFLPLFRGKRNISAGNKMSFTGQKRIFLRERIRSALPIAADGSIMLNAGARAVKALRP